MNSEQSLMQKSNIFASPPNKRFLSPKSLSRKPNFINFTKKKATDTSQIKSSDRIRYISPSKANLFISEDSINVQNSSEFNITQYSSNEHINYPFIKKCASPKHIDSIPTSRRTSFCDKRGQNDKSFLSSLLEPSIQDFSNYQMLSDIHNNTLLQQQISELKKRNFQLNLLVDQKNQVIESQRLKYDMKLTELTKQLYEIKLNVDSSEKKITQTEEKMSQYQLRVKQLQTLLSQTNQKLDKAQKEIKMYKAKFRLNYNTKDKQKQDLKCKKYHQNCCGRQEQQFFSAKSIKNQQNICTKNNVLKQSKKINNNVDSTSSLKKIKSQNILPVWNKSVDLSSETSCLMNIHQNQNEFNSYIQLKIQIENLLKEIRYKDIEILTLKKTKCEFEKQKQNYEKVKKFNKKLLARVQFLTKQCDQSSSVKKRLSLPSQMSPQKKFTSHYEDFDEEQNEDQGYETLQFQLSPERNFPQKSGLDEQRIFDEIEMN